MQRWATILGHGGRAAAVAGVVSGAPSTLVTLSAGRSPRATVEAAGALVGRPTVPAGAVVHAAISLGWATVLAALLPRRHPLVAGAAAGLAIAALDLGIVGRRVAAIRALAPLPQVADHVAFGVVAAAVIERCRQADDEAVAREKALLAGEMTHCY
jgi:hypothetical protein